MSGYPTIVHTEEGMRDGLQIENPDISVEAKVRLLDALSETGLKEIAVETLAHARHFILGPKAYAGAASPWKEQITSYQRPEFQSKFQAGESAAAAPAPMRAVTGKQ